MFLTLKLHRNFNDTWRAKRTISYAQETEIEEYKKKLEAGTIRRRTRPRRPRRRSGQSTKKDT